MLCEKVSAIFFPSSSPNFLPKEINLIERMASTTMSGLRSIVSFSGDADFLGDADFSGDDFLGDADFSGDDFSGDAC